jgi:hypothetical protein
VVPVGLVGDVAHRFGAHHLAVMPVKLALGLAEPHFYWFTPVHLAAARWGEQEQKDAC